ncbi:PH domain-containing protein [Ornithinimicrobium pekingense]|uniref:PH domain-containing protein n=1 Tax=Ornithinimicrobium pekingense TaxID=384677 RepID=A0ABQ2FEG7_9MICO|nr:PH domain-containing protein [Ornithinimicrobium pekingense]GGK79766.1 hypothetical protein GCM10011509_30380 [Ornithinimicrobium pekingense]
MTWVRHRSRSLSWALLAAVLLVVSQGVWRYTRAGVPLAEDGWGLVMRVVVLGLLVGVYLRAGGATTASEDGLSVHDGVRRHDFPRASVRTVEEDPARNGAVAVLQTGRRVELPGVSGSEVRAVRRALKGR